MPRHGTGWSLANSNRDDMTVTSRCPVCLSVRYWPVSARATPMTDLFLPCCGPSHQWQWIATLYNAVHTLPGPVLSFTLNAIYDYAVLHDHIVVALVERL